MEKIEKTQDEPNLLPPGVWTLDSTSDAQLLPVGVRTPDIGHLNPRHGGVHLSPCFEVIFEEKSYKKDPNSFFRSFKSGEKNWRLVLEY